MCLLGAKAKFGQLFKKPTTPLSLAGGEKNNHEAGRENIFYSCHGLCPEVL